MSVTLESLRTAYEADLAERATQYRSSEDWLSSFSDEEQEQLIHAIVTTNNLSGLLEDLRDLDERAFPFSYDSLKKLRRTLTRYLSIADSK